MTKPAAVVQAEPPVDAEPGGGPRLEPPGAWAVVWATFTALAVIFGVAYSFGALFAPLAAEFQAPRAQVSLVFGLSGLVYFLLGPVAGLLADRYGPRAVCSAGMVCIAAGLVGASLSRSLVGVYIAYAAGVGVGIALVYTPSIACVQPWFTKRRGLAAGLASAGIGAGTLLVPLLASGLIGRLDWRPALWVLTVGVLVLGLGATLLLRRAPAATSRAGAAVAGHTLRQALATPQFRWLYLVTVVSAPGMFVPFAHVSAAARDLGVADAQAVGLVGMIGIGSLTGRFVIGALADRIGRPLTLALGVAALGAGFLWWGAAKGYPMMVVYALWHGLAYGGIVSLLPALCMDMFGARAVSSILGTLYSGAALGNLAGPWLAGAVFDAQGSYQGVVWGCLALGLLAATACWPLVRQPHPA